MTYTGWLLIRGGERAIYEREDGVRLLRFGHNEWAYYHKKANDELQPLHFIKGDMDTCMRFVNREWPVLTPEEMQPLQRSEVL